MSGRSTTTGGDPAGGADPGGTRSTKNRGGEAGATGTPVEQQGEPEVEQHVESGDRNAMTKEAPIEEQDGGKA